LFCLTAGRVGLPTGWSRLNKMQMLMLKIKQLVDPDPRIRKTAESALNRCLPANDLVRAYVETLPAAEDELAIIILRKLEKLGRNETGIAVKVFPLIYHQDYLVRSRTFITLGRLGDNSICPGLVAYIREEPGEEWQLRALECLLMLKDAGVVPELAVFLKYTHNPLLIRGVLWLIGYLGGSAAVDCIGRFVSGPQGRMVKSEVILEAMSLAVNSYLDGIRDFSRLRKGEAGIDRFFRYSTLPDPKKVHFHVYPYPDYLLDQAALRGIEPKAFKRLSFWDRGN